MIVNLVGNTFEIKKNSTATPEYIPLSDVTNIFGLFIPAVSSTVPFGTGYPELYPYPSRTQVTLTLTDRYSSGALKIELQSITAGILVAFNGGTKANLDSALAALAALIP